MRFLPTELSAALTAAGVPAWRFQLADGVFESVGDDHIPAVWAAWIEALRRNAPECLTTLALGGGKTRRVPKWIEEAGDCDNHALLCFAHAQQGNWINACVSGAKVGRSYGPIFYTSQPRAENRNRAGRHCLLWVVNHYGQFRAFEPGDGDYLELTFAEKQSITFGLAA